MATFHPLDYVSLVRRRKWWLIAPAVVCIVGSVLLAYFLPRVYRSASTITAASPSVSADLLKQAGPLTRDERVRAISQQLLSRAVLEQVVREERLAPDGDVNAAVDRLLQPNRIKVEPTQLLKQVASRDGPMLDAFLLSYGGATPPEAQRVTETLARIFVEASSRSREARAEDTSAFVNAQLAASRRRLEAIEERLRKAKEAYMGRLPEQTQSNLSMVAGMQRQLESTAIALRGEQDRLSMIERQIESMKQGAGDIVLPGRTTVTSAQMRVLQLDQELATARNIYTDKHPEIQRLQENLAAAKRDAAAEQAARPETDRLRLDPGYRQLLGDRETSRLRIRDLQRAEVQMRAQVTSYQARIESAPMVEQQLASVQREYDLERQQYKELTAKLQAAELAENLERRRAGEQFQVLYGAYLPRDPESPNVLRVLLLGVVLGIGLGGAAAVGREYLDRSVHDVRALQAEFDVPVLGEISRITRAA